MTKPTIRELLSEEWADKPDLADMLAERVEAVLRLKEAEPGSEIGKGYNLALHNVRRALEGEESR